MGADICLAITKCNRIQPINDAMSMSILHQRIDALPDRLIVAAAEQYGMFDVEDEIEDEFRYDIRSKLKTSIEFIDEGRRDVAHVKLGEDVWAITGGMSWGDPPTNAYDHIAAIDASGITQEPF